MPPISLVHPDPGSSWINFQELSIVSHDDEIFRLPDQETIGIGTLFLWTFWFCRYFSILYINSIFGGFGPNNDLPKTDSTIKFGQSVEKIRRFRKCYPIHPKSALVCGYIINDSSTSGAPVQTNKFCLQRDTITIKYLFEFGTTPGNYGVKNEFWIDFDWKQRNIDQKLWKLRFKYLVGTDTTIPTSVYFRIYSEVIRTAQINREHIRNKPDHTKSILTLITE